ncbi:phosphate:Na+ symporter [Nitrosomonas marina]|uniref:Phosphate:Na+ symporter n=1 Tax=Nitrosomonas marina TaxID=917 RepID=A0A1I0DHZ7_9PROT|nr:Na/Pi cotransporter family protein [Nitrosomonas marina]SET31851.1 phosphate:Na+ symporter [Nitrosomonas marina]
MTDAEPLAYGAMITGLGGGLALFLYGMRKMTEALKIVAGGGMKNVLARLTSNRFSAVTAGALVTAVIQSSSVTTVMVVSFVSAGVMTFSQSIGVILGANIGTTITAQIIAFKITKYALVMIAAGFLIEILAKRRKTRYYGTMLMGLGLLFFGMELMSNAALPLRTYQPFIEVMQEMRNPFFGMLAGVVFTTLVQSSSATTGIVIVLATQGLITLEAGIALLLGASVGTCITAMLSAIGKPREAVKAATVHVIFNLVGVVILLPFIPQFADLVRTVSPEVHVLTDLERLAAEVPRQIANAHTLFNVASTLVFICFTGTLAALVEYMVPSPAVVSIHKGKPVYLQELFLDQPALALDQVKLELGRMGGMVVNAVEQSLPSAISGDEETLETLRLNDDAIDKLHEEILAYLGKLSLGDLVEPQPLRIEEYTGVANYLENLGDIVESGFVPAGFKRLERGDRIRYRAG